MCSVAYLRCWQCKPQYLGSKQTQEEMKEYLSFKDEYIFTSCSFKQIAYDLIPSVMNNISKMIGFNVFLIEYCNLRKYTWDWHSYWGTSVEKIWSAKHLIFQSLDWEKTNTYASYCVYNIHTLNTFFTYITNACL